MKTALCAAAIGATMLIGSGLPASSAPPGYIVTLEQVGSDVVATGGGAIDLAGLTFITSGTTNLRSPRPLPRRRQAAQEPLMNTAASRDHSDSVREYLQVRQRASAT